MTESTLDQSSRGPNDNGIDAWHCDEITNTVKDLISNRLDKTVYVRSDARAKYGDVIKTVDEIRSAGVDNIGLLTQKIEPRKVPGAAAAPPPPPGGSD